MTHVRVLAPWFAPAVDGGGPIRTLAALTESAPAEVTIDVVTRDRDLGATVRLPVPTEPVVDGRTTIRYLDTRGVRGLVRLADALRARPKPGLTYVNSVFDARFAILPLALHRIGLAPTERVLIAPRGEFDPGALTLSARKKRCFLAFARAVGLFNGVVWHASTETEAAHIREVAGARADVVVRENETALPSRAKRHRVPLGDRLELVTVGRISPKKRTHLVIEALAHVRHPVRLRVIGPADDAAYARRCAAAADRLPEHVEVRFLGSLPHATGMALLAEAHAAVTATAGENFGHTIVEALAVGRPLLLSDTTPWTERVRAGGGTIVADDAWTTQIEQWAAMSEDELSARSAAAADAYDRWRSAEQPPHVFDLVLRRR